MHRARQAPLASVTARRLPAVTIHFLEPGGRSDISIVALIERSTKISAASTGLPDASVTVPPISTAGLTGLTPQRYPMFHRDIQD